MTRNLMKDVNSIPETRNIVSLDEYKKQTGGEQLQQIIQTAVAGAISQLYLDNPIPDHPDPDMTMTTVDTKLKRCCVPTEYGNI